MTVLADHGAPLGVSTRRAFNSAAAARADIPANSERIGAMARARSRAPACRVSLIAGSRGPPSLTPRALAAARPGLGAVADHAAFLLRHRGIDVDHEGVGARHV